MMTLPLVFAFDASQQGDNLNNAFLISTQAMPCLRNYAKHLPLSTDGLQRSGRACWKHQVSPLTNILCFDLYTVRHVYQINYLKQHAGCPRLAVIMRTNWRRTRILKVSAVYWKYPINWSWIQQGINTCPFDSIAARASWCANTLPYLTQHRNRGYVSRKRPGAHFQNTCSL